MFLNHHLETDKALSEFDDTLENERLFLRVKLTFVHYLQYV